MIKNELLVRLTSFWFFPRWHPEVALRYLPIVEEINKLDKGATVLDVGSGGLGITPYLKRKVTGVDIAFSPPFHPLLKRVKSSATKLPFANSSFDVVISVDMLEHLKEKARTDAICEMLRVARKKVLLGVPCSQTSYQQDVYLDKYYQKKFKKRYQYLKEQINLGLPKEHDIYDTIMTAARVNKKTIHLQIRGNENLQLRLFLMKGFISNNFLLNIFFRKFFLLAIPLFRLLNHEPTYRKLFFVDIIKL